MNYFVCWCDLSNTHPRHSQSSVCLTELCQSHLLIQSCSDVIPTDRSLHQRTESWSTRLASLQSLPIAPWIRSPPSSVRSDSYLSSPPIGGAFAPPLSTVHAPPLILCVYTLYISNLQLAARFILKIWIHSSLDNELQPGQTTVLRFKLVILRYT